MTLVEALAAIIILATVLVLMLVARSRWLRQDALSRRALAAVQTADELLQRWFHDPRGVPREDHGMADSHEVNLRFEWRTSVIQQQPLAFNDLQVVRLEVRSGPEADKDSVPLASVEVLVTNPTANQ